MKICFTALFCMALASCETAPGKASYDNAERLKVRAAADKGEREAQYQLGNSYCCGEGGGFWDTNEAVKWWCKAAAQGQKEAAAAVLRQEKSCDVKHGVLTVLKP